MPPLRAISARKPFEIVGIDVVGPLPTSSRRKYIIVAVDYLTKFAETRALTSFNAQHTAAFFTEQILLRHGAPVQVISDRGKNFIASLFKRWLKMSNICTTPSTAYHPQTNGLCERVNGIIVNILRRYIDHSQEDWSDWLPWATFAYNTTPHSSTNFTPFELVYGRPARLPLEPDPILPVEEINESEYHRINHRSWELMRELARTNIAQAQDNYTFQHDLNTKPPKFQVGDRVKIAREQPPTDGRTKKLEPTYDIGYIIVSLTSHYATVKNSNGRVDTVTLCRLRKDGYDPDTLNALDNLEENNIHASVDNAGQNAAADQLIEAPVPTPQRRVTFLLDPDLDSTLIPAPPLTTNTSNTITAVTPSFVTPTAVDLPMRRGRGRPRIHPLPDSTTQPNCSVLAGSNTNFLPDITSSLPSNPPRRDHSCTETSTNTSPTFSAPLMNSSFDSETDDACDLPPLRRSTRLRSNRRHANLNLHTRSTKNTLALLLCLNLLMPSFASLLSPREPLAWARTDRIVASDTIDLDFTLFYASPCEVLEKLEPSEELKVQCHQLFETSFLQPLNKFCKAANQLIQPFAKQNRTRPKREIVTILAIFAVVGLLFSAGGHYWEISNINYLKERQEIITRTLEEFEYRFQQQERAILALDRKTQRTIALMTFISSNLFWTRHVLENTAKRWQREESVDPDLLTAFNMTHNCDPPCPPEHMWSRDCKHDTDTKILQFSISAIQPTPNVTVFQALPFELYRKTEDGYCRFVYQGPPLASFNNKTKQTCLIKEQQLTSAFIECLTTDPRQLFVRQECYQHLFPAQVIQIHRSPHSVMIFCFPFTITVQGQLHDCPDHVIELPANVDFNIAGHQYSHYTLRFSGRPQFVPEWTFKLNNDLINSGENLVFHNPSYPRLTFAFWLTGIVVIFGLFVLCICCLRSKKQTNQRNQISVTQTLDLHKIRSFTQTSPEERQSPPINPNDIKTPPRSSKTPPRYTAVEKRSESWI